MPYAKDPRIAVSPTMPVPPAILYLTYDGVLDPLGQSQVLPYLIGLARHRRILLLSFEKDARAVDSVACTATRRRLEAAGILWFPRRYHQTPTIPATCFDIAVGAMSALWISFRYRASILHARSLLPAIMALPSKLILGAKLLFDIRGFWVDCRAEQGAWPKDSLTHRTLKLLESLAYSKCDAITTLTRRASGIIKTRPELGGKRTLVATITTCTDLDSFCPTPQRPRGKGVLTVGYVGSVGPLYMFSQTLDCFRAIDRASPGAQLLVVNQGSHREIWEDIDKKGINRSQVEVRAARRDEVPEQIRRMDIGLCFVLPTPSMAAAAPTKIGEYLACGVPVVANTQPGDLEELFRDPRIGAGIRDFTPAEFVRAANHALSLTRIETTAIACRATAERLFSLSRGVACYAAVYRAMEAGDKSGKSV